MSAAEPAMLVMAAPGPFGTELEELLGRERLSELREALVSQAETWGRELADGVFWAADGDSLGEALTRAFGRRAGPLLVVWPWLAQLRDDHISGALGDLAAGCDVVLGPVIDGGLYLLALARPVAELVVLPEDRWQDPDVMTIAFAAARDAGLEVGILRAERALRGPADVRAALADPLLPEELRRILGRQNPQRLS